MAIIVADVLNAVAVVARIVDHVPHSIITGLFVLTPVAAAASR